MREAGFGNNRTISSNWDVIYPLPSYLNHPYSFENYREMKHHCKMTEQVTNAFALPRESYHD